MNFVRIWLDFIIRTTREPEYKCQRPHQEPLQKQLVPFRNRRQLRVYLDALRALIQLLADIKNTNKKDATRLFPEGSGRETKDTLNVHQIIWLKY